MRVWDLENEIRNGNVVAENWILYYCIFIEKRFNFFLLLKYILSETFLKKSRPFEIQVENIQINNEKIKLKLRNRN